MGNNKHNHIFSPNLTPLNIKNLSDITTPMNTNNLISNDVNFENECDILNSNPNSKIIKNELFDYLINLDFNESNLNFDKEINKDAAEEPVNIYKKYLYNTRGKNSRQCKSKNQLSILETEYELNKKWNKCKIKEISKITGLSEYQVYKWNWDKKKLI